MRQTPSIVDQVRRLSTNSDRHHTIEKRKMVLTVRSVSTGFVGAQEIAGDAF